MTSGPTAPRDYCYRCMRAASMCLCEALARCANRTRVHVLQHYHERSHAFGTVRLLKASLDNIAVDVLFPDGEQRFSRPPGLPSQAAILYPGEGSVALEALPLAEAPDGLIVLDGTWNQVHRLYRDSPWLHTFPTFRICPAQPSGYRIREEPGPECLSTLESVVYALTVLEPDNPDTHRLLSAFTRMNDDQLRFTAEGAKRRPRTKRHRPRTSRAVPAVIVDAPERIVLVGAETGQRQTRQDPARAEMAQWAAVRLADPSCTLDQIVRPSRGKPDPSFLQHLGWQAGDLDRAIPLAEARDAWEAFLRPGDVVFAWEGVSLRLASTFGFHAEVRSLKHVYANTVLHAPGSLDDVVAREALEPAPLVGVTGRAATRLAGARDVALHLAAWARQARTASGA